MFAASAKPKAPSATEPAACEAVERGELPSRKRSYPIWPAATTALATQAASLHSRTWLGSAELASIPKTMPLTAYATATRIIARIHARPDTSKGLALGSGHQLVKELSPPRPLPVAAQREYHR